MFSILARLRQNDSPASDHGIIRGNTPSLKFSLRRPIVVPRAEERMDGIAATRVFREDHATLPIVLYTAYLDDAIAERAYDAGVTACIGKVEGIASLAQRFCL